MAFRRILIATDFSPQAAKALEVAADLAGRLRLPLVILTTFELPTYPLPEGGLMPVWDGLEAIKENYAKELVDQADRARALGVQEVDNVVVEGRAATEIVRVAKERGADLIVVGSHGRGFVMRAVLGSTADRVVRTAHCPVMVVAHTEG
jgi:nucleotide-binding universal stress UspA family protein